MIYTKFENITAEHIAFQQVKGCYQRELLSGDRRWSGADLKGKAKEWSMKYKCSRENLLKRLTQSGLSVKFENGTAQTGPLVCIIR